MPEKKEVKETVDNEDDAQKLHRALSTVSQALIEAADPWARSVVQYNIKMLHSLINQELILALQALCNNLQEIDCVIPHEVYELIEEVGIKYVDDQFSQSLGVSRDLWEGLKVQVLD